MFYISPRRELLIIFNKEAAMSEIVETAQEALKVDREYWEPIYNAAREDIYFLSGRDDAQWDQRALKSRRRSGRPVLTIDQLGQYVNQVVNDIRKNTPSIKVIPSDDGDVKKAEVIQGLIRNILYTSSADTCFDIAAAYAVKGSIGFFKLDHGYVDDTSFEQCLKIESVVNPFSCFLDSNSVAIDGSDAEHCFILDSVKKSLFEKRYKGKSCISFCADDYLEDSNDSVVLAEYYTLEKEEANIGLTAEGQVERVVDGVEYRATRTTELKTINKYLLSGADVLEKTVFVGSHIPLIPVFGDQMWVNGEREIQSLIRKSKDAQRMFNFWKSLETELLQKQPNAPYIYAVGQIEDFADLWKDPNKAMALPYKQVDVAGNPAPPPQRQQPPEIPTGIVQASRSSVDDIKASIGMYGASIGERTNEVSGVAIERRNEQCENASYHFNDNLNKSIEYLGKVLLDAIPEIYDTPRLIRVIGIEEEADVVGINGLITKDQKETIELSKSDRYDVKIVTGPAFTTQRQAAAHFFEAAVLKNPDLMPVMGDLLFKYMDIAGAEAMYERMKKYIDPKYSDEAEEEFDPEKEQMRTLIEQGNQLIGQQQAQIEDLTDELRDKQGDLIIKSKSEENKLKLGEYSNNIDLMKLESENKKAEREYELKMAELKFKADAIRIKDRELDLKENEKAAKIDIEIAKLQADEAQRLMENTENINNLNIIEGQ